MNHEKGMNKSSQHVTFPIPILLERIILSFDFFGAVHKHINQVTMVNQAISNVLLYICIYVYTCTHTCI